MWTFRPELVSDVLLQMFDKRTRFDSSLLHVCLGVRNTVAEWMLVIFSKSSLSQSR